MAGGGNTGRTGGGDSEFGAGAMGWLKAWAAKRRAWMAAEKVIGCAHARSRRGRYVAEGLEPRIFLAGEASSFVFPGRTYAAGIGPNSVAAADLDADGDNDLVVANSFAPSGTVSVLRNNGDGTLGAPVAYVAGSNPNSVVAKDLDGDGDIDLAVANFAAGSLSILRNNGNGTFAARVGYNGGSGSYAVAAADVDGDGDVDLAVANYASGTVSVLRNNGNGTFDTRVAYAVGSNPVAVTAADLDGDGDADLAVANRNYPLGTVSMLRNDGNGTFAAQVAYAAGGSPSSVAAADLDGDGDADLAVVGVGATSVLRNNGNGTFVSPTNYAASTSFNFVTAADLDSDGDADLVAASAEGATVLENDGAGGFAATVAYAMHGNNDTGFVVLADLDGDADADLAITVSEGNARAGTVSVLRNNGDGTFAAQLTYNAGSQPWVARTADLDGDGDKDLAVLNHVLGFGTGVGTVSVLLNNGTGSFAAPTAYEVGTLPTSFVVEDLDGDGDVDLAVTGSSGYPDYISPIRILRNNGDGTFATPSMYGAGSDPASITAGDFDGDGDADLAVTNSAAGTVSVLRNNGDGSFAARVAYSISGAYSIAAADLDGDGDTDLATVNSYYEATGTVSVLRNNGDGTFTVGTFSLADANPWAIAATDVDGDGDADLVVAASVISSQSGTVLVLRNNGNGTFAAQTAYPSFGLTYYDLKLADLDGDGDIDLVLVNTPNGGPSIVSVLANNGNGAFNTQTYYAAGYAPRSVALADLDGDEDVDLVVANRGPSSDPSTVSVFLNSQPRVGRSELAVSEVSAASNAVAGRVISVSFVVSNVGRDAIAGDWLDTVYLSTDGSVDASDTILGRFPHLGGLATGASYTVNAAVPFLLRGGAALPAGYRLLVKADSDARVPETNEADNVKAAAPVYALAASALTLGSSVTAALKPREASYYALGTLSGQAIDIVLDGAAGAGWQVFVRFGSAPDRTTYDFSAQAANATALHVLIPSTRAGTYQVMVYSPSGATTASGFTLVARASAFGVRPQDYGRFAAAGSGTVRVVGSGFDRSVAAALRALGGPDRPASRVGAVSQSAFFATFDLRGLGPGHYDVVVSQVGAASVVVASSLEVVEAPAITVPAVASVTLTGPAAVSSGRPYAFRVSWRNDTLNDVPAPLLVVTDSAPFGARPGDVSFGTSHAFLAASADGPRGILRPGTGFSRTFYADGGGAPGAHTATIDRIPRDPNSAFNWETLRGALDPGDLSAALYDVVFARLIQRVGATAGDVARVAASNADRLTDFGDDTDVADLLEPDLIEARADLSPSIRGVIRSQMLDVDLGGRRVTASNGSGAAVETLTLADGSFAFADLAPGTYLLDVQGLLETPAPAAVVLGPSTHAQSIQIGVRAGAVIAGLVTDAAGGRPVAGATIMLLGGDQVRAAAVSDAAGRYVLSGLEAGSYSIRMDAQDLAVGWHTGIAVTDNQRVERADALAVASSVAGTVVSAAGAPLSGVVVYAMLESGPPTAVSEALSAADGGFVLIGLPAGAYTLRFEKAGYQTALLQRTVTGAGASLQLGSVPLSAATPGAVAAPPLVHPEDIYLRALALLGGPTAVAMFDAYLGYAPSLFWEFGPETAEARQFARDPTTKEVIGEIMKEITNAIKADIEHEYPGGVPRGISINREISNLVDFANVKQLPSRGLLWTSGSGSTEAEKTKWTFPFYNGRLSGAIAGGVGQWGGYGYPDGQVRDDLRLLNGTAIAYTEIGSGVLTIDFAWNGFIEDGVDFNPGETVGPVFSPFAFREFLGSAFDQPFRVTFKTSGQETTNITLASPPPALRARTFARLAAGSPVDAAPAAHVAATLVPPAGVGIQRWTSSTDPMQYTIQFGTDATVPAAVPRTIKIEQFLDPDLDWWSFRLEDFALGEAFVDVPDDRASYSARLDLRGTLGVYVDVEAGIDLQSGKVSWDFTAIDPTTNDVPTNPTLGLLLPGGTRRGGEGWVGYTVSPKTGTVTGSAIDATATVTFDATSAVMTASVFNSLDAAAPSSTATILPAIPDTATFKVTWAGVDDANGSGVGRYDVYVSDNGGPYALWLANTTATSGRYRGAQNHSYLFYSIAQDNAGNAEAAPLTADALTLVNDTTAPTVLGAASSGGSFAGNRLSIPFSEDVGASLTAGHLVLFNATTGHTIDPDKMAVTFDLQRNLAVWTFPGLPGGLLPDGNYTATLLAAGVADGAANALVAGITFGFYRLGGDTNGDRTVDGADRANLNADFGLPPINAAEGDSDGDHRVDFIDLVALAQHYNAPGNGPAEGDFNSDGVVDFLDLVVLAQHYNTAGRADFNDDGQIDDLDRAILDANFGVTLPVPGAAATAAPSFQQAFALATALPAATPASPGQTPSAPATPPPAAKPEPATDRNPVPVPVAKPRPATVTTPRPVMVAPKPVPVAKPRPAAVAKPKPVTTVPRPKPAAVAKPKAVPAQGPGATPVARPGALQSAIAAHAPSAGIFGTRPIKRPKATAELLASFV